MLSPLHRVNHRLQAQPLWLTSWRCARMARAGTQVTRRTLPLARQRRIPRDRDFIYPGRLRTRTTARTWPGGCGMSRLKVGARRFGAMDVGAHGSRYTYTYPRWRTRGGAFAPIGLQPRFSAPAIDYRETTGPVASCAGRSRVRLQARTANCGSCGKPCQEPEVRRARGNPAPGSELTPLLCRVPMPEHTMRTAGMGRSAAKGLPVRVLRAQRSKHSGQRSETARRGRERARSTR